MSDYPTIIYLDNNATSELSDDVASVVVSLVTANIYGNPSSTHEMGLKIRAIMDVARYGVAQSLGCGSEEIIFTSGGTEANNLALRGIYSPYTKSANDIVISAAEHASVFHTAEAVATENKVRLIPLKEDGSLDMEWAERLITDDTSLVSVMLANNETGVLFPVKQIVELAHKRGALVHCDAVQVYGRLPIDVRNLGVDLLSISGHKTHALPGIGALYVRKGVLVRPIMAGGGHEFGLRPGTENYIGVASLGTISNEISQSKAMGSGLRDAFETGVKRRIPNIVINGEGVSRVPNTSSITFKGVHSSAMLVALGEEGICASAGAACSSERAQVSRTLTSMGVSEDDAFSTIRFSFSRMSKMMDAATAIEACVKCTLILRQDTSSNGD